MITDINKLDLSRQYTYADYLTWRFQERVELFRGWVKKMSPAPSRRHQEISGTIFFEVKKFLTDSNCRAYTAPFDVLLQTKKGDTVVQPDICVVCDLDKLTDRGCTGAPDLVVEILSPGNTKKEMKDKMELYREAGVPEYWVIDPEHQIAFAFRLDTQGTYQPSLPYTSDDVLDSQVLPGLDITLQDLFKE
jgi:Uma2 family endonuclease